MWSPGPGRWEMNNDSDNMSDSLSVVMPLYHIDSRSIHRIFLVEVVAE